MEMDASATRRYLSTAPYYYYLNIGCANHLLNIHVTTT